MPRRRARLLFCTLLLSACTATLAADATLRLDYYHTGDSLSEHFSLDRLVREPLPWPGNPDRPIDATFRGKYVFEVLPEGTDAPSYTRSFSSIYGEWETTAEAKRMKRTFHESLRFPDPGRPFEVIVKKRDANNDFAGIWRLSLDPSDYLVHEEHAAYGKEVVAIEQNGDPAHKVDLLLLGDGYTADETEAFLAVARELTDLMFSTSPFRERREDFNVWALAPVSARSGVSRPSTGTYRDTPLGTSYDAFRSERYVLTYDNRNLRRIASSAPYDFIEILTNTETYGGGGIYGLFSTAAANSEWAGYLFIHEFAHHFAGLADEYYTSSVAYEPPETIVEPYEPNVTALLDPERLKWRQLVDEDTPLPTPWPKDAYEDHSLAYQARRAEMRAADVAEAEMNALFRDNQRIVEGLFSEAPYRNAIGAFEGAMYQAQGYYRSEMNCIMFTRTEDFCRVCSDALEAVIDEYSAR
ncbi:MAG: M64 family metallopeptidase [Woeseiaceae bacterium]|nr:M64 family metallopeptidase [Woeseiaceae bacterium]